MKKIFYSVVCILSVLLGSCSDNDDMESKPVLTDKISYTLASDQVGKQYFPKEKLHEQITPYFLDLIMRTANYPKDQWMEVAMKSIQPSTPENQAYLDSIAACQNKKLSALGLKLPLDKPIEVIDMSMEAFSTAVAFTSGAHIYAKLSAFRSRDQKDGFSSEMNMWHEVWHVLSRNNPELRRQMYALIGFTVLDEEVEIPEEVKSHLLCNPDIERHDSYASFEINGKPTDCLLLFYAQEDTYNPIFQWGLNHYTSSTEGSWLLALDPQTHKPYRNEDGKWALYNAMEVKDFMKGLNTPYNFDPEECMADNFAFAMMSKSDCSNQTLLQKIRDLFKMSETK